MRSHRCQQRHHKECTIPPGSGAMFPCNCSCHTEQVVLHVNHMAIAVEPVNETVNIPPVVKVTGCPGHKTPHLVWSEPIQVWAGSKQSHIPPGMVVLDLADVSKAAIRVEGFELGGVVVKRVIFDWPDMQTPHVSPETWQTLAAKLVALGEPVYVACMGGHGRTGTTLAILGSLMGAIPEGDPVAWLRSNYCPSQVETQGQLDYVAKVTGRVVSVKAGGSHWVSKAPAWIEGTDLELCRYAKTGHNGCSRFGHELKVDTVLPKSYTGHGTQGTVISGTFADQCPVCHAYAGHFSNCSLKSGGK